MYLTSSDYLAMIINKIFIILFSFKNQINIYENNKIYLNKKIILFTKFSF